MSSDLLQQAMIDAAALKEAAMKNAENALIEKYSQEFNQTVQKLLEQEDPALAPPAADPAAAPPAQDPAAATPEADAAPIDPMAADPMAGDMGMAPEQSKAFSKVPGAFSGDDEELITINFDQIKATLNEMLGVKENEMLGQQDVGDDALAAGGNEDQEVAEPDITVTVKGSKNDVVDSDESEGELELELEDGMPGSDELGTERTGAVELEEVELEEDASAELSTALADKARAEEKVSKAQLHKSEEEKKAEDAAKNASVSSIAETIELSEEELEELAEELKVDLNVGNMSDGYMGSTETQKREQRAVELAAARDEKAEAEREAEKEKMADLMKENKDLKSLNDEAIEVIASLKDQVEKLNVLNAKLLYTNKALANVSLNERQKNNIVESISKADSVLAAKTIYETVQNALDDNKKERTAPQSLRETLNRAASPFVVKKTANNSINDLMAERMKTLAGIKKLS